MQMTSRRPPCMSHIGNHLSSLHLLTNRNADAGTMGIQGRQPAAVVDLDIVPVTASPAVGGVGNGDGAVCGGQNWRSLRCRDIGTAVLTDFSRERIGAVPLRRGDCSRHRQRPLQGTIRKHRIHAGRHELPAPLHKTTQQFTPKGRGIFS